MKNLLKTVLVVFLFSSNLFSQTTLEKYLKSTPALEDFCTIAHPFNDCVSLDYRLDSNYVIIELVSRSFGINLCTNLKLTRGFGDLYFNNIEIIRDCNLIPPFTAFKAISTLIYELMKKIDPETTQKISNAIASNFGSNPENWSDNTWALYAINLSYAFYLATH
ncbi:hypothetical protein [uncultured Kordia sp.]|uniref:hypothetical protein n=1 Tax=uncultured Kordia sp. TaxID=507699 RepID=UPI00262258E2|nr:hypothetical protein [uncultured Kordia sp.]